MQIIAGANNLRISPRKIRLLADAVKGLSVDQAILSLQFVKKIGADELRKTIIQAKANALNHSKADKNLLKIKEILINEGPILKRMRAVSRGMSHSIKKRTSHIKVYLEG